MTITFNCNCGKTLSCKDEDAGLKGVCPYCKAKLRVPGSPQPGAEGNRAKFPHEKIEGWVFAHQRQIIVGAVLIGLAAIGAMFWFWGEEAEPPPIVRQSYAQASPPAKDPFAGADPTQWKTQFNSFAAAVRQASQEGENLEELFTGHQVDWEVTFASLTERTTLYFLESEPLLKSDRGIRVWASLLPSQAPRAVELIAGDKIRLRGKIGPVTSARSATHPLDEIRIGPIECTFEVLPEGDSPVASNEG